MPLAFQLADGYAEWTVSVSSIALLMVVRELGVDIAPMLTGAGIVGVALGFGSQYLVRDVIAGFFLILEAHDIALQPTAVPLYIADPKTLRKL